MTKDYMVAVIVGETKQHNTSRPVYTDRITASATAITFAWDDPPALCAGKQYYCVIQLQRSYIHRVLDALKQLW